MFDFFLQTTSRNGDPCLQLAGSCREYSLDRFNQAMKEATAQAEKTVYLDLSQTKLLDSASLGTIVSHFNLLRSKGKSLVLLNPSASCKHLLEITSLNRVLVIETDSPTA
ncbi:MAG TPA: STAS domain-containing protein [Fibrobacteria bacterium]|nr:STAS domain-containing protein [Fibrobacteria bacterium]